MFNRLVVVGNLCHTPEIKYSKDGKKFCKLSIAVNYRYGEKESVTFFSACVFEKSAEFVEKYAKKGCKVLVEGQAAVSSYMNKDGEAKASLEIKFAQVKIIDWKEKDKEANNNATESKEPAVKEDDEECPF